MITYLTEEQILLVHFQLVERYGGSHGVRDIERIKSVAHAVRQEAFGVEQYPSLYEKAAVYVRNIIADHPFADGNKRTGITSGVMFLRMNKKRFSAKRGELEDFAVKVATDHLSVNEIAAWLEGHCVK
ncbi:MAG TPA: type II toxin-antitoxin system death-on-curing family toxin [Verrucomicrobiae bacterium]|nr:type II toxin-antitoxin system death-on-curing family toxin [Verrucomicrobiae bacterium]